MRRDAGAMLIATAVFAPLAITPVATAQAPTTKPPVVTIREFDDDNAEHLLGVRGVSDVNSTIRIEIDPTQLRAQAALLATADTALERRIRTMNTLRRISTAGLRALPAASRALAAWVADTSDAKRAALEGEFRPIAAAVTELATALPTTSSLRREINSALQTTPSGSSILVRWSAVMDLVSREADRLQAEVDRALADRGTVVLLGAWLMTSGERRGIHLEGFDSIPKGEFFELPRYTVVLSEADREKLETMQREAADMRRRTAGVESLLENELARAIRGVPPAIQPCVDQLRTELTTAGQHGAALLQAIEPAIDLVNRWGDLGAAIRTRFGEDATRTDASLLSDVNSSVQTLQDLATRTPGTFEQAVMALQAAAGAEATAARQRLERCKPVLAKVGSIAANATELVDMFRSATDVETSSLEFSSRALRRDIASVAQGTSFRLTDTGRRDAGDRVVVRLAVAEGSGTPSTVEERQFTIDRVVPHVYTATAFVFADPLAHTGVTGRFQPAASYSILYSRGSRGSAAYNRLVRISWGLNLAAMDFDKNDSPELGVGAVLTFLVDLIQIGGGYNVQADAPYWFFGVRLPTGRLPGTF